MLKSNVKVNFYINLALILDQINRCPETHPSAISRGLFCCSEVSDNIWQSIWCKGKLVRITFHIPIYTIAAKKTIKSVCVVLRNTADFQRYFAVVFKQLAFIKC